MVRAGLGYLSACDAAELGTPVLAEALIGLEQAGAQHTAARARMLAAFTAQHGHQADGQYGPASWLRAFTRITHGAAGAAVTWARRLAAHPLTAAALAAGQLSSSWAKMICAATDRLPEDRRADADRILLAAAGGGAGLADLAALARQMIERSRTSPDRDRDRFDERAVWLQTTLGGAGHLTGDLTGPAAAAVAAVLDALSAQGGAEDTRSLPQRQHDALAEACQRLIATRPAAQQRPFSISMTWTSSYLTIDRLNGYSRYIFPHAGRRILRAQHAARVITRHSPPRRYRIARFIHHSKTNYKSVNYWVLIRPVSRIKGVLARCGNYPSYDRAKCCNAHDQQCYTNNKAVRIRGGFCPMKRAW